MDATRETAQAPCGSEVLAATIEVESRAFWAYKRRAMNGISSRGVALVLSLLVLGCRAGSKEADWKEVETQATRAADQTYQVRGVLVSIDAERSKVNIQHEEIPDFKDSTGKVVGMSTMTMPFHVAPSVDLTSFTSGDKVTFTLEVRWETKRELLIPEMNKLAADTELQVK